ncbi:MAG: hypothetical protein R3D67_12515 [Hyphomicrobiaceae bacterium]
MRRVTVKRSADGGVIEIRAGEKVVGQVSNLQSQSESVMSGTFAHRPAFADIAPVVLKLSRALNAGDGEAANAARAELEAAKLQVWHTSHDMRIDRAQSLVIAEGTVTFAPNDAFIMMRTGGL